MLSILMLIRNTHRPAATCLQSVARSLQSLGLLQKTEFVLIDDASDEQESIVPMLMEFRQTTAPAARIVHFKQRQHYTRGLAAGLSLARGDAVLFVSHDMIVTPGYIRTLLAVGATEESIGVVRGTSTYVDCFPQHVVVPPLALKSFEAVVEFGEYVARAQGLAYVEDPLLTGDSMLIKRRTLEKVGVFDPRYYGYFGDVDFGLRVQRAGMKLVCAKGAWLVHEGAAYYKDQAQTQQRDLDGVRAERLRVVQAAYEQFRQKWDKNLPEQYPGADAIDFQRLRIVATPAGGEYQSPVSLDEQTSQIL